MSRRWVAAGAGLVLVAATVWFGWWMRHPEGPRWSGYGMGLDRAVVGKTIWMPLYEAGPASAEDRSLTLVELEPLLDDGSARDVEVEYFLCEVDPVAAQADGVSGVGYGARDRDVEELCETLDPAVGAELDLSRTFRELVVAVTPLSTRPVVIGGHRVQLTDGARTTEETVDVELRFTAVPRGKR